MRYMRRATLLALLALLPALLLGGCGVSPEGVAEEFVTRFAERSFENLDRYVAEDQRAEFRETLAEYQAVLANPKGASQELQAAMMLEIDDLDAELVSEDATNARVRLVIELDIAGPAKGAPFLDTDNRAVLVREASLEGSLDVLLVKEKGRWMVDLVATSEIWHEALKFW